MRTTSFAFHPDSFIVAGVGAYTILDAPQLRRLAAHGGHGRGGRLRP